MARRFVLAIKDLRTGNEIYKARFVVQGYTDVEKNKLVHACFNVRQQTIRILIALAAIFGPRSGRKTFCKLIYKALVALLVIYTSNQSLDSGCSPTSYLNY